MAVNFLNIFRNKTDEGQRRALVIGIDHYEHADLFPRLINAGSDAEKVAIALEKVGFEVTRLISQVNGDITAKDIREVVNRFRFQESRSSIKDVVCFYFAGHGARRSDGQNVLCASDTNLDEDGEFENACVANSLIESISQHSKQSIFLIDACRKSTRPIQGDDGMPAKGLAEPQAAPKDSFIAFATAPGQVAEDGGPEGGPFAKAVAEHIPTNGLEIRDFIRRVRNSVLQSTGNTQTPWHTGNLRESFQFQPFSNRPAWFMGKLGVLAGFVSVLITFLVSIYLAVSQVNNDETESDKTNLKQSVSLMESFDTGRKAFLDKVQKIQRANMEANRPFLSIFLPSRMLLHTVFAFVMPIAAAIGLWRLFMIQIWKVFLLLVVLISTFVFTTHTQLDFFEDLRLVLLKANPILKNSELHSSTEFNKYDSFVVEFSSSLALFGRVIFTWMSYLLVLHLVASVFEKQLFSLKLLGFTGLMSVFAFVVPFALSYVLEPVRFIPEDAAFIISYTAIVFFIIGHLISRIIPESEAYQSP